MSSFFASRSVHSIVGRADAFPLADPIVVPTTLIIIASICLVLTLFAVVARALTKVRHWRREFDDFAIIIAEAGFIAFVAMSFESAINGESTSISNLPSMSLERVRLLTNILSLIHAPTILAAKVAILMQASRYFSNIQRTGKYCFSLALVAVCTAGYTAVFFLRLFACTPREKISNPHVAGHCLPEYTNAITTGALSVSTNAVIVIVLWSICPKLHLSQAKKVFAVLIMSLGIFACVCSSLQLVFGILLATSNDYSKAVYPLDLWALAEMASLIIIACCPTLPHGLRLLAGNVSEHSLAVHGKWYYDLSSKCSTPRSKTSFAQTHSSNGPFTPRTAISTPTRKGLPAPRPFATYEPSERALSRKSSLATLRPLSRHPTHKSSNKSLASTKSLNTKTKDLNNKNKDFGLLPPSPMTPTTPVSPAFSTHQIRDAWEMRVTPVCAFGHIKRTIQVRVSNHTIRGSKSNAPTQWGAPDTRWEPKL